MLRILTIIATLLVTLVTVASASAASGNHVCRQGDPPITASAHTSCSMAGAMLNAYYNGNTWSVGYGGYRAGWVRSPVTKQYYMVNFKRSGYRVTATGKNGIKASFAAGF
jgi:hypothetical protein